MPIYPRLIHPVPVVIEQIDHGGTFYDADAREPVQQASRRTLVTIKGQAGYSGTAFGGGASGSISVQDGGVQEKETGFVTFRTKDLETAGVTLALNDRFTRIGNTEHDAYITRLQPMGHYPGYNSTLVRAYFQDRQPAKHKRRTG